MTTVLDATVLLNYGRFEALWIPQRSLPPDRIVVPQVVAEVVYPPEAVRALGSTITEGRLRVHHSPSSEAEFAAVEELRQTRPRLGPGELASLAACLACSWSFASDDREARLIAQDRGIVLTGTMGILIGAVEDGIVDLAHAESLFRKMIGAGYRAPVRRLADLIDS